jgi:DNA-binding MarR family transcriptional regulator
LSAEPAAPAAVRAAGSECAEPAVLAERLRLTMVRLGRRFRRADPPGLSITLYSALSVIADRGELAVRELAEAEAVPSSAATRVADRLEEASLVARRPNPADRRGVNLVITDAGRQLVDERRQRGNAWLAARLAGLTAAQRQVLADGLAVLDAATAADGGPAPDKDVPVLMGEWK